MSSRALIVSALLLAAAGAPASEAATPPRAPCAGCTLDVPDGRDGSRSRPLIVVMHGDRERADTAAKRWRTAALARGWAVLSLQCPREQGCREDSWYKWNGAPSWVHAQVKVVAREMPQGMAIDERRIYLIGWSGGATYIGKNATSWTQRFAAVVIHGGGQPPNDNTSCPNAELPAYFLVGDKNPAHSAAVRLRGYLEGCREELVWSLVPGADHAAEDAALDRRKADEILDWLEERTREPRLVAR